MQRRADGSLAAVAVLADVRFSGGGNVPLATFNAGGGNVTYSWPSALPSPMLEGDSAVYPEVMAGVDLRVRALVDGFGYSLVVKDATAATNPELQSIQLDLAASGLVVLPRAEGGFDAVDSAGKRAITVGGAAMWDASGLQPDAAGASALLRGPDGVEVDVAALVAEAPEGSAVAEIAAAATATSLVVTPDQAMLTDPGTVFPVVIDPVSTVSHFTWGYSNSTNATRDDGIPRVGRDPKGSGNWRSYFFFNSGSTIGGPATVTEAEFRTTMTHSWSCGSTPVNLYAVAAFSTGKNTWPGPGIMSHLGERSGHAHKPSEGAGCFDDPQPDQALVFDSAAVKAAVQYNLDQGWTSFAAGLMAARPGDGPSESTESWWKKFDPADTKLYIEWNRLPTAPTNVKVLAKGVTDCAQAGQSTVTAKRPTFCGTPQDADSGTNRVEFEVWNSAHTVREAYSNGSVTNRTVNSAAPWTSTVDLADGTHALRVQSCDADGCSKVWSPWVAFTIDSTPSAVPSDPVPQSGGSATYQAGSTGIWAGGVGLAGNFKFTSADAKDIEVELNGVSQGGWKPTSGGVLTLSITPTRDGPNTLRSRSRDALNNDSAWSSAWTFYVKAKTNKSWRWEFNGAATSIDTEGSTVVNPGVYPLSGPSPTYVTSPQSQAADLNGAQALVTGNGVTDVKSSFTVTARVLLSTSTPSGPMTIVSQDGPTGSGFRLQYRTDVDKAETGPGPDKVWCFTMFTADGAADTEATRACALAPDVPEWTNLAGVYDAVGRKLQLWVNGEMWVPETSGFTNGWAANGVLAIGRARQGSTNVQYFDGLIDRVAVFAKPLTSAEINNDLVTQ